MEENIHMTFIVVNATASCLLFSHFKNSPDSPID